MATSTSNTEIISANSCGRTVGLAQVLVTRRLRRGFSPRGRCAARVLCGARMVAQVGLHPARACVLRIGRR
eukprot:7343780-Lingulodinium_polyedra.AAC.1